MHSRKHLNRFMAMLALTCCSVNPVWAQGQDPWWFEVEAIIFERNIDVDEVEEHFPLELTPIEVNGLPDFIRDTLLPDFDYLRQGADICLSDDNVIPLPAQTRAIPQFYDVRTDEGLASILAKADHPVSKALLQESLIFNLDWVIQNTPSQQWQAQLDQFLLAPNSAFSSWREQNSIVMVQDAERNSDSPQFSPTQLPETLYCQWPAEAELFATAEGERLRQQAFLPQIPNTIDGLELPYSEKAYTLPSGLLELKSLRRNINRTRGLNVLLHTAWRQNVIVGRENAPWYRLTAGENFSRHYHYSGLPKQAATETPTQASQESVFSKIKDILQREDAVEIQADARSEELAALQQPHLNDESLTTWTLDGRIKIFIEYLGRTPYLHLDSDLNFRKPVFVDWYKDQSSKQSVSNDNEDDNRTVRPAPNFLKAFHFDQLRRMISTELHYFDHPFFGMVVQIRRYQRPEPPTPDDF